MQAYRRLYHGQGDKASHDALSNADLDLKRHNVGLCKMKKVHMTTV